jgi:replicative DNA helicase
MNTGDLRADERFCVERELLGALLRHPESSYFRSTSSIVEWDQFHDTMNGRLFGMIGDAVDHGIKAGFPLASHLIGKLADDPQLTEAGITSRTLIANYLANAAPEIGIEGCARQVKYEFLSDNLRLAVENDDTESAEKFAAEMERLSKAHLTKDDGLQLVGKSTAKVVDDLQDVVLKGGFVDDTAFPGSNDIAGVIGGFRRGRMYVIGGRPGAGKTTTGLSLLLKTARKGHGVLFVELEMTAPELSEMALCDLAYDSRRRIEYRDLSARHIMDKDFDRNFERIVEVQRHFDNLPFLISDRSGLTINEIRSQAQQYAQKLAANGKRLDVVCVDHLNLIRASGNYRGNKVAETEEVSNALKALAKELQCAVVVLVQLNRAVEGREDKRPGLADLRWSGAIEQDADVVMFVYREAYYLQKPATDPSEEDARMLRLPLVEHKLEIVFAKNRGGPTPIVELFCDMGCSVVRDIA